MWMMDAAASKPPSVAVVYAIQRSCHAPRPERVRLSRPPYPLARLYRTVWQIFSNYFRKFRFSERRSRDAGDIVFAASDPADERAIAISVPRAIAGEATFRFYRDTEFPFLPRADFAQGISLPIREPYLSASPSRPGSAHRWTRCSHWNPRRSIYLEHPTVSRRRLIASPVDLYLKNGITRSPLPANRSTQIVRQRVRKRGDTASTTL